MIAQPALRFSAARARNRIWMDVTCSLSDPASMCDDVMKACCSKTKHGASLQYLAAIGSSQGWVFHSHSSVSAPYTRRKHFESALNPRHEPFRVPGESLALFRRLHRFRDTADQQNAISLYRESPKRHYLRVNDRLAWQLRE
eukprot:712426-Pleurochrysis_carterae.AAC.1